MSSISFIEQLRTSRTRQHQMGKVIRFIIALVLVIFALFPVVWTFSASVDPASSLGRQQLIPNNAGFNHYINLWNSEIFPYPTWLWNSIKVSSISTLLSLFITTISAYAFSRFRFMGRQNMLKTILLIQVFPGMLAMIALFAIIQQIGNYIPWLGLNTHAGLILVYMGGAMGINIWLMKGFFDSIPKDIDESAMVDGATHWQTFWLLLFPLIRPILVVVGILTFVGTYSDFILARVLLTSTEQYTVMVGLFIFQSGQFAQNWGPFTAGALMAAVPIIIIYLLLQDYIVGGLTQGAVKG
ncbi:MAG: sugar ABC transporter permease [Chloroflexota bacterium]|jgi:arabinogalactan oligomer / maltooligosaccharide transport system permease protein